MERVFFVGLGAAKAGTSWLANRLDSHPQVMISPLKELHWFDEDPLKASFEKRFARHAEKLAGRMARGAHAGPSARAILLRLSMRDDRDYMRYFEHFVEGHHAAFGEISPSYSMLPADRLAQMARLSPSTRFLYLMRNPVDRLWSQYRFTFKDRDTSPTRFDFDALESGRLSFMVQRGDYANTLARIDEAILPDRVFVAFYEDLFSSNGSALLASLWRFLGVEPMATSEDEFRDRVNVSPRGAMEDSDRERLIEYLATDYNAIAERFDAIPHVWRDDMKLLG